MNFSTTPSLWRAWLAEHQASGTECLVGFCTVGSGEPSITWPVISANQAATRERRFDAV